MHEDEHAHEYIHAEEDAHAHVQEYDLPRLEPGVLGDQPSFGGRSKHDCVEVGATTHVLVRVRVLLLVDVDVDVFVFVFVVVLLPRRSSSTSPPRPINLLPAA